MRTDVRKAVGRHREKTFPRMLDADAGQRWKNRLEVGAQLPRRGRELRGPLSSAADRPIGAAQKEPMLRRPSRVVIRPLGVPDHHVSEPDVPALRGAERRRGEDVGVIHPESTGQRPKVLRRVAGCDDDARRRRRGRCACGPARRPVRAIDPRHGRSFEDIRARGCRRAHQAHGTPGRDRTARCLGCGWRRDPGTPVRRRSASGVSHSPSKPARSLSRCSARSRRTASAVVA